jgi:chromosome segregation ATPase
MSNQNRFNDEGANDKRRKDPDLRRFYEELKRQGKECNDKQIATQKSLDDTITLLTVLGERSKGQSKTLDNIENKLTTTSEKVAAIDSTVDNLRTQNGLQVDKISELESEVNYLSKAPSKSPLISNEGNIKWVVVGVVSVLLVVLLAYGVITVDDVKALKG